MADVRGLVGIDAGVLDDHATGARFRRRSSGDERGEPGGEGAAVEEEVDETSSRHFGARHSEQPGELRGQFLGDVPRLAADLLREVEGEGQGHVPEFEFGGGLDQDLAEGHPESLRHRLTDADDKVRLESEDHEDLRFGGVTPMRRGRGDLATGGRRRD